MFSLSRVPKTLQQNRAREKRVEAFWRISLIASIVGCLCLQPNNIANCGQNDPDEATAVKERLDACVSAPTSYQAALAYKALFCFADSNELRRLQMTPHHGVAFNSAWENVLRSTHKGDERRRKGGSIGAIEPRLLHRFMGFTEGRLQVAIPSWWEHRVLDAKGDGDSFRFPITERDPYHKTESGWYAPSDTMVQNRGADVVFSVDNDPVTIPAAVLQDEQDAYPSLCALVESKKYYLAIHSVMSGAYSLYAVDRSSSTVLWKSRVWANENEAYQVYHRITLPGEPEGTHRVALMHHGSDQILLFGAEDTCVYIESFRTTDGMSLFRFSTSY